MPTKQYLAMDFGAESGRGELVTISDDKITYEEIHRFNNRPVRFNQTLYWDFPYLFAETLETLSLCQQRKLDLSSIAVDTWGVDFGLLDGNDQLLGLPVHYRDSRTADVHETSPLPLLDIYQQSCCEPWAISSLFQLHAMRQAGSGLLDAAKSFLNMPDLFNFGLTGIKANEKTIVSTGNLMTREGKWSQHLIEAFNLPDVFHGSLIEPGTTLGPLSQEVRQQTGLGEIPVVATCGHDTAGVVVAVPATEKNWAFLSCGTWSILGVMTDPITTADALDNGFTNEYTLGGWFCGHNILGLWLVQELKRKWDSSDDRWDYDRITTEAAKATAPALIDAACSAFMAPDDMEHALLAYIQQTRQVQPDSRGELVRCVLESLALEYAQTMEHIKKLTNQPIDVLYMVGGGIKNELLCQATADACGMSVYAGVDQCTAVGNALTQAIAMGQLSGLAEARQLTANSFQLKRYDPKDHEQWKAKRERYQSLKS